jgi:hypothetical protein
VKQLIDIREAVDVGDTGSSLVTKFIPVQYADAATIAQIIQATLVAQAQERETKGLNTIRGSAGDGQRAGSFTLDAATVADRADFANPFQYPVGIIAVIVNGAVAVRDGQHLANRGRVVRAAVDEGLLMKGGGHAMAAGLTIARERLVDFRAYLEERLGEIVEELSLGRGLGLSGILGGHFARIHRVQDLLPGLRRLLGIDGQRQRVEPQPPFLFLEPVAGAAVPHQQRAVPVGHHRSHCFARVGHRHKAPCAERHQ